MKPVVQVLKQLACEVSYRSLVTLGIASIQGIPVASFEKEDADRLLFLWNRQGKEIFFRHELSSPLPPLCSSIVTKRSKTFSEAKSIAFSQTMKENGFFLNDVEDAKKEVGSCEATHILSFSGRKRLKVATMKPVPCSRQRMLPLGIQDDVPTSPSKKNNTVRVPLTPRNSAPGDWVSCGSCSGWAHLGCDRRQGLATFKDYAKTDGLEYICPNCSVNNRKRKSEKVVT
ncbi:hypothetical protein B296_00020344 [Ensete ventricosum]|uniref:Uncharacterized protein n=1 Tax=Ensete ventricosum TaxID=4639 RepID=A0A426ZLJ2_ENSVE|nr:hypothetical protein B296_00020344 [Ensete ventricosum]